MRACTSRFTSIAVAAGLLFVTAGTATASPPTPTSPQLPTGSTVRLPGTRVPTAKLDGWITIVARGGLVAGEITGLDANIELLFAEAMGVGFGFLAGDDSTTYIRLTCCMLDIKYWLWTGYFDFFSDDLKGRDGLRIGTALSVPISSSNNMWLRFSLGWLTESGEKLFGAGLEVAVW